MSKKPDLPRGVVDHPAKDQMRELWEAGKRGSEIAEFLESAGHLRDGRQRAGAAAAKRGRQQPVAECCCAWRQRAIYHG